MNEDAIKTLLDERKVLYDSIFQKTAELDQLHEKFEKMNAALFALKELYPEWFPKEAIVEKTKSAYEYDRNLPFRRRIKELLISMKRFTKVSELAKIVHQEESFFLPDTEEDWQKKISATLTSLKKIQKERITKKHIEPGAWGFAWGLEDWLTDQEKYLYEEEKKKQMVADEDDQMNFFEHAR